ncbi:hypothetical protein BDP55DRAFT_632349 [Colletotrichum godetiae]|uniref:Uncharacterized protein n=1 Tax=Colletotrichum godetiae TaxID=1209918 RepID=A0AAJ0EXF4_9PEZI|nr:uncharacterized protein BDP55DRAFT_632349 [Colletotrichum godetiae]KAK1675175.1 hypothetical protein BDP55DRAFT_632349 [Colletotrichum godetiae]
MPSVVIAITPREMGRVPGIPHGLVHSGIKFEPTMVEIARPAMETNAKDKYLPCHGGLLIGMESSTRDDCIAEFASMFEHHTYGRIGRSRVCVSRTKTIVHHILSKTAGELASSLSYNEDGNSGIHRVKHGPPELDKIFVLLETCSSSFDISRVVGESDSHLVNAVSVDGSSLAGIELGKSSNSATTSVATSMALEPIFLKITFRKVHRAEEEVEIYFENTTYYRPHFPQPASTEECWGALCRLGDISNSKRQARSPSTKPHSLNQFSNIDKMYFSVALVTSIVASAIAIPASSARMYTVDTVANELACVAYDDMACARLVSKRSEAELANELACVVRGDMACAGSFTDNIPRLSSSRNAIPRWSSSLTRSSASLVATSPVPVSSPRIETPLVLSTSSLALPVAIWPALVLLPRRLNNRFSQRGSPGCPHVYNNLPRVRKNPPYEYITLRYGPKVRPQYHT